MKQVAERKETPNGRRVSDVTASRDGRPYTGVLEYAVADVFQIPGNVPLDEGHLHQRREDRSEGGGSSYIVERCRIAKRRADTQENSGPNKGSRCIGKAMEVYRYQIIFDRYGSLLDKSTVTWPRLGVHAVVDGRWAKLKKRSVDAESAQAIHSRWVFPIYVVLPKEERRVLRSKLM